MNKNQAEIADLLDDLPVEFDVIDDGKIVTDIAPPNGAPAQEPQAVAASADGEGLVKGNRGNLSHHSPTPHTPNTSTPDATPRTSPARQNRDPYAYDPADDALAEFLPEPSRQPTRRQRRSSKPKPVKHAPVILDHVPVTPWRNLTPDQKLQAAFQTAGLLDGDAFSLNLDPKIRKSLLRSGDPARALSLRLRRAFLQVLGFVPPLAFVLEAPRHNVLHVHGVLVAPDVDRALLRDALKIAGGKITGYASGRQVDLKPLDGARSWLSYLLKDVDQTRGELVTVKTTFINDALRREARDRHEHVVSARRRARTDTATHTEAPAPSGLRTTGRLEKRPQRVPMAVPARRRTTSFIWSSTNILQHRMIRFATPEPRPPG